MQDRKVYIDKMAAKLKEWDDEILKLENKTKNLKDDASGKYKEQIAELKSKSEDTRKRLKHLREASDDAWHELKDGMEESWQTLEQSVKKAWKILQA